MRSKCDQNDTNRGRIVERHVNNSMPEIRKRVCHIYYIYDCRDWLNWHATRKLKSTRLNICCALCEERANFPNSRALKKTHETPSSRRTARKWLRYWCGVSVIRPLEGWKFTRALRSRLRYCRVHMRAGHHALRDDIIMSKHRTFVYASGFCVSPSRHYIYICSNGTQRRRSAGLGGFAYALRAFE